MSVEDVLDEIARRYGALPLKPGEITSSMYAEKYGKSVDVAREHLIKAEKEGLLEYVGWRIVENYRCKVWRVVKERGE